MFVIFNDYCITFKSVENNCTSLCDMCFVPNALSNDAELSIANGIFGNLIHYVVFLAELNLLRYRYSKWCSN